MRLINLILVLASLALGPSKYNYSYEAKLDEILIELEPSEFIKLYGDRMIEHRWTEAEIEEMALMAQTEAYGLGMDGMLSVLATGYGRYQSVIWCSRTYCAQTLVEEINRPRQFDGPYFAHQKYGKEVYDIIKPGSFLAVYKFILGFRGSCSGNNGLGYEYFNSIYGGSSECKIMDNGQFVEFFSSQKYNRAQEQGLYRNIYRSTEEVEELFRCYDTTGSRRVYPCSR
jgi:hypothetical protein